MTFGGSANSTPDKPPFRRHRRTTFHAPASTQARYVPGALDRHYMSPFAYLCKVAHCNGELWWRLHAPADHDDLHVKFAKRRRRGFDLSRATGTLRGARGERFEPASPQSRRLNLQAKNGVSTMTMAMTRQDRRRCRCCSMTPTSSAVSATCGQASAAQPPPMHNWCRARRVLFAAASVGRWLMNVGWRLMRQWRPAF